MTETLEGVRLVEMPVRTLIQGWRPGSHGDDWTWQDETRDLFDRDAERTLKLKQAIFRLGFGLADKTHPVKLGNDGRVWNGHHRIVLALYLGVYSLMVHIVGPEEKEHEE